VLLNRILSRKKVQKRRSKINRKRMELTIKTEQIVRIIKAQCTQCINLFKYLPDKERDDVMDISTTMETVLDVC
jgi:hypothetical protein